jgi:hypothetical protein
MNPILTFENFEKMNQISESQFKSTAAAQSATLKIFLLVGVLLASYIGYFEMIKRPRMEAVEAADKALYDEAIATADHKIETIFKKWSAITVEQTSAFEWVGAKSNVLYTEYVPPIKSVSGSVSGEQWKLWAMTGTGRIYFVTFWLDEKYQIQASETPIESSLERLMIALVSNKRQDLIKKLDLPLKPA